MKNPKNILITGANSGIGKALAISYLRSPCTNLFLCARDLKKLDEIKKILLEMGTNTNIQCESIDVRNEEKMKSYIERIEKICSLDLVIANAGISAGTANGTESFKQVKEIFSTNLNGVLNTIHPVIEKMKIRQKGQIAIISSLAGFRGLPSSPAYSASKSAVRVYAESLRGNLADFGIEVSAICPGYIRTPMTEANDFPMPFLMDAKKCSEIIKTGLKKNKSRIAFPFPLYFLVWLASLLSTKITDPFFARLPKKKSL